MTEQPIESTPDNNSALQSFRLSGLDESQASRPLEPAVEWSNENRGKAALVAVLITIAAEFAWIRLGGYFGFSLFTLIASLLLYVGIKQFGDRGTRTLKSAQAGNRFSWSLAYVLVGILVACARMVWQGNVAVSFSAIVLLGMFSLTLHRKSLEILQSLFQWATSAVDGIAGWVQTYACIPFVSECLRRWPWAVWGVPIAIGSLFMVPLFLAHPDLVTSVSKNLYFGFEHLALWIQAFDFMEIVILLCVATMSMGMLLPICNVSLNLDESKESDAHQYNDLTFFMVRNSLFTVVVVFIVFLAFEFYSLWFRTFPLGFHYSGYRW